MAMPVPDAPTGYSLQHYTTFPGSAQPVFSLCYNMVIEGGWSYYCMKYTVA